MSEIHKALEEIESVNLKEEEAINKLEKIISTELKKLPLFLTDLKAGEPVVRARYLKADEDFHRMIKDYSYNPNKEHIKIGRANYAEQPVFYASRFRVTALGEVRFIYANREKDSVRYSLGRWEVSETLPVAAIVTPELIRKFEAKELFGLAEFIEETENKYKDDKDIGGFLDIYRYMAERFTEPIFEGEEYKYKITAVFSNFIFSKLQQATGILYQSVQYPENFNVAFKKEIIDSDKLKLTFCANQKYVRTGHLNYKEERSIETTQIDYASKLINWDV